MAKITEKEIATQALAREDRLAATAKTTGAEEAYLKVAKTAPNRRRIAAAQALDGLAPLLTPAEGVAWIEQSRAWLNQELDEPLF